MKTKDKNLIVNDTELEKVSGGVRFNDITIGDIIGTLTSENKDEEAASYKVGFFPGLSGFP